MYGTFQLNTIKLLFLNIKIIIKIKIGQNIVLKFRNKHIKKLDNDRYPMNNLVTT